MQNLPKNRDNSPAVYKTGSVKQRNDVSLTKEIVITLTNLILEGKSIYPKEGFVHTHAKDGKVVNVSRFQLNSWVSRQNVVPETGEILREVLDRARLKRRQIYSAMMQNRVLERAEGHLNALLAISNNVGSRVITRHLKLNKEDGMIEEVGRSVRDSGINTKLVSIKTKAMQFALERLDPEHYGRRDRAESKNVAFSLVDLRRLSEEEGKISK